MLPGCGSPCTNPWHASILANVSASAEAAAAGSIPARLSPGPSSTFTPRTYSMVSTRPVVRDQWILGVTIRASSASARPVLSQLRPSHVKSSSLESLSRNSGTRKEKSNVGNATQIAPVMKRMVARSTSNCLLSPGRCTFTATSSPALVTALCTCASDAAAIGSRSNSLNDVDPLTPPVSTGSFVAPALRFTAFAAASSEPFVAPRVESFPPASFPPPKFTRCSTARGESSFATISRTSDHSSGLALS
mmetsp:Transcript_8693/g.35201  ORF Transcript_8693/g.35201 Transcript_8693/m.35201 type:complete len:248 (+) Transcript_8693:1026-1769(+)